MRSRIANEVLQFRVLLRSVPSLTVVFFTVSVVVMNLLANKSISLPVNWLALDCGIIVSWVAFLSMDMLTRRFGPKAATEIAITAAVVNLLFCGFLFAASKIPGIWAESMSSDAPDAVGNALDATFGGTWYVLLGSTLAFVVSAFVNNFLNFFLRKFCKNAPQGFKSYIFRSYISTAVGQFTDNLVFAFSVSYFFFGWSPLQCVVCALTGMIAELLCEVVFSRLGYSVCIRWERDNVGKEYLDLLGEAKK